MSTDQDELSMYNDLIGFLKSDRSDLRLAATEAVMAVKDPEGMTKLIRHGVVPPLTRLSSHPGTVGLNALVSLVHLSSQGTSAGQCVEDLMSDAGAMSRMIEITLSTREDEEEETIWKKRVNLAMSLLVNMTRTERGAVELVGRTLPDEALVIMSEEQVDNNKLPSKPTLELLLARFLSTEYMEDVSDEHVDNDDANLDSRHYDPYQHFAAVLMNATQVEAGRRFVLRIKWQKEAGSTSGAQGSNAATTSSSSSSVLQAILIQLRSKNPIRRRGVAGTIKNCCLERNVAYWLLEDVKIVKHLLYPLAGPEELTVDEKRGLDPDLWLEGPDKEREPDALTRLFLVECLLLLCASGRKSRQRLRLERVYVILKLADMVEDSEDVSERINECVQFLRRDEEGTEEGSSDKMVDEVVGGQRLVLPAPSVSRRVGSTADYDDVD